jgi:hypothetical protein
MSSEHQGREDSKILIIRFRLEISITTMSVSMGLPRVVDDNFGNAVLHVLNGNVGVANHV